MPYIWEAFIEDYKEYLIDIKLSTILKAFYYYEKNRAKCEKVLGVHNHAL